MHYYYGPTDGRDLGFGLLMMVFWLILFVFIAAAFVRYTRHHEPGLADKTDPLDIVRERYAKGEITKEQYEQLRKDLK